MFIDKEFSTGSAHSAATLVKWVDHPGTKADRRGMRRSCKRKEQRNIRKHVTAALLDRAA